MKPTLTILFLSGLASQATPGSAQSPITPAAIKTRESPAAPSEDLRLRNPTKEHLTASQVYQIKTEHKSMREMIGQFVLVDLIIEIPRDVPLAIIELDGQAPDANHRIYAHLENMNHFTDQTITKGERFRIEGILVNEGYGAYMIYLTAVKRLKSEGH
jgi:hypothetical protein